MDLDFFLPNCGAYISYIFSMSIMSQICLVVKVLTTGWYLAVIFIYCELLLYGLNDAVN